MECFRQHLIGNLSIECEDFDAIPVLSDHGGWDGPTACSTGSWPSCLKNSTRSWWRHERDNTRGQAC
jgi:hypothetical protein